MRIGVVFLAVCGRDESHCSHRVWSVGLMVAGRLALVSSKGNVKFLLNNGMLRWKLTQRQKT
jgi:hypothetical protein